MNDLLDAALDYAGRGWPVFPLHSMKSFGDEDTAQCACGGCDSPGKRPQTLHGLSDATTDPEVVRSWWKRWPSANVGIRTGVAFDVIDLDSAEALDTLDAAAPPDAGVILGPIVTTGRGVHIYVQRTGCSSKNGVLPKIDFKAGGGYVVAPPSVHYTGTRYTWADEHDPTLPCGIDAPLSPCPAWFVALRTGRGAPAGGAGDRATGVGAAAPVAAQVGRAGSGHDKYGRRALEAECGQVAMAGVGTRNEQLNRSAFALGQLIAGGVLDATEAVASLLVAAERCGLGQREADATVISGLRAGARSPRRPAA